MELKETRIDLNHRLWIPVTLQVRLSLDLYITFKSVKFMNYDSKSQQLQRFFVGKCIYSRTVLSTDFWLKNHINWFIFFSNFRRMESIVFAFIAYHDKTTVSHQQCKTCFFATLLLAGRKGGCIPLPLPWDMLSW